MPTSSSASAARLSASQTATPMLGDRIRQMRRERGWKLADLSGRSTIAMSTLSKVENNVLSLSYDRLILVARAFDMTLSEFLAEVRTDETARPAPSARISFALGETADVIDTPNYTYRYLCTNLRRRALSPVKTLLKARTLEEFGPLVHHTGEEFAIVLKGRAIVHTEHYSPQALDEGEGVYIDSAMGHAFLNGAPAGQESWILFVTTNEEEH